MRHTHVAIICFALVLSQRPVPAAPAPADPVPAYQRFLSPASPLDMASAEKADRLAWIAFEEGKRNAYTAAPPSFAAVRLTSFLHDDGVDMSALRISADGSIVTFIRGAAPNRDGWVANPSADPDGPTGRSGPCARQEARRGAWPACPAGATSSRQTAAPWCSSRTARSTGRW